VRAAGEPAKRCWVERSGFEPDAEQPYMRAHRGLDSILLADVTTGVRPIGENDDRAGADLGLGKQVERGVDSVVDPRPVGETRRPRERRGDRGAVGGQRQQDLGRAVEGDDGKLLRRARLPANARAAAIAASIGLPRMLSLASIRSTTPDCSTEPPPDGVTDRPATRFPFSRTVTPPGASRIRAGRLRTNARSGNDACASVM
jgi:hypothetical protein